MVIIEMEGGGLIKLELDPSAAPNTVKNFKKEPPASATGKTSING